VLLNHSRHQLINNEVGTPLQLCWFSRPLWTKVVVLVRYCVCVCVCVRVRSCSCSGHPEGLRSDHQPDPGREPRARVQLRPGGGAGGAGAVHRQGRQRVSRLSITY